MDMGYRLQSDLCSLSRPDFLKMFVYKTLFYGVVLHVECKTDLFSYQNVSVKIKMGRCLNFTPILHHKIVISPRNIGMGVGFVCFIGQLYYSLEMWTKHPNTAYIFWK